MSDTIVIALVSGACAAGFMVALRILIGAFHKPTPKVDPLSKKELREIDPAGAAEAHAEIERWGL